MHLHRRLAWGLLFVFTILPFLPVLNCGFVAHDDQVYVYENALLQRGLTWENLRWCFSAVVCGNWHPLTMLSLLVDYELAGLRAGWYHAVNLLLHIGTVSLLFLFLVRTTRRTWLSFWVALLFAIHPLRVESVAWVSERKDVLCGFFWMLTLLVYVSYRQQPNRCRYLLVLVCLLGALLAKPMAVTLPFVLLLVDVWPLRQLPLTPPFTVSSLARRMWPSVREKMPMFLLSGVMCGVTYLVQASAGAVRGPEKMDFSLRVFDSAANYAFYIVKTLHPANLSVFYGLFGPVLPLTWFWVIAAVLIAVTGLVVRYAPTHPWFAAGWFWYLGTLVPVIGIVQIGTQSFADRYSYLPSVGLFIMAVWGVADFRDRFCPPASAMGNRNLTAMRRLFPGVAVVSVAVLGYLTFLQTSVWKNSVTLFVNAVDTDPRDGLAYAKLSAVLANEGEFRAAGACAEKAIQLAPSLPDGYVCRAIVHEHFWKFAEAIRDCRKALALYPQHKEAWYAMAMSMLKSGQTEEAVQAFLSALAAGARPAGCHGYLAQIHASHRDPRLRDGRLALKHALAVCEDTMGKDPHALAALAAAYAENGRFDEAVATAGRALALVTPQEQPFAVKLQEQLARYRLREPWRQDFCLTK